MFVALAVVVLVGVMVLSWSEHGEKKASGNPPDAGAEHSSSAAGLEPANETPSDARQPSTPSPFPTSERTSGPGSFDRPPVDPSLGRWIITDSDGRELHHESGQLKVRAADDAGSKLVTIAVEGGGFATTALGAGRYVVESAKAGDEKDPRVVVLEDPSFACSPGKPPILRGTYLRDTLLHVVDAETAAPLTQVSVLTKWRSDAGAGQDHPGPHFDADFFVRERPSPVRLPRVRGVRSYWVTAAGYAWSFLQVDHESGGQRYVRLERGGRLEVQIVGKDPTIEIHFRLRSQSSGRVVTSFLVNEGTGWQRLWGVPPGDYDARVEIGSATGEVLELARAQTKVRAGETTQLHIDLGGDPILPLVPVKGVIVLPPTHAGLRPSLRIRRAQGPPLHHEDAKVIGPGAMWRENGSDVLHWNADHLTSGRYLFVVEPFEQGVLVDVPQRPLEDVRIEVPDLYAVTVCAVDAKSREPIGRMKLHLVRPMPVKSGVGDSVDLEPDTEQGCVNLFVPAGAISLSVRAPDYGEKSMESRVGASGNEFTFELEARIPRDVVLFDGDTAIPWMEGVACTFRNVASTQVSSCDRVGQFGMRALFEAPGEYELDVGRYPGFHAQTPVRVSIEEGTGPPIVIRLTH
jgi:hypothetical protein